MMNQFVELNGYWPSLTKLMEKTDLDSRQDALDGMKNLQDFLIYEFFVIFLQKQT